MTGNLQAWIDKAARGSSLKLEPPRCEIQGPVIIRQPVVIIGQGCSFWAEKGPVLSVQCSGVVLNDLNIEVTGSHANLTEAEATALLVGPKLGISLNNVVVRGNVLGLDGEEGSWRYPRTVRLGDLQADQQHTFTVCLALPVACQLTSEIAGLEVQPRQLSPGLIRATLLVEPMKQGTRLRGFLKLRTPLLTRQIQVTCTVQANARGVTGTGQVIYQPDDWAALTAAAQTPKPPVKSADLTSPPIKPATPPLAIPVNPSAVPADLRRIPEAIPVDAAPQPATPTSSPVRRRPRRPDMTSLPEAFRQTTPLGETVPTEEQPAREKCGSTPLSPIWGEPTASEPEAPVQPGPAASIDSPTGLEPPDKQPDEAPPPSPVSPSLSSRPRRLPVSSLFVPAEMSSEGEAAESAAQQPAVKTEPDPRGEAPPEPESPNKKPKRNTRDLPTVFGDLPPKG